MVKRKIDAWCAHPWMEKSTVLNGLNYYYLLVYIYVAGYAGHLGILLGPPVAPNLQTGQKHIYEKLEALSTSQRVKILSYYRL